MDINIDTKIAIRNLFVKKDCDIHSPNVQAAIITAASKMARVSNIVGETETQETLIDLYEVRGMEEVTELLGMAPQFVKASIGYATDFEDLSSSTADYYSDKTSYDILYKKIETIHQMKKEKEVGSITI